MATAVPIKPEKITNRSLFNLRQKLKLNQRDFWTPLGVTQSGGSRYETGRKLSEPARRLAAFVYQDELKKYARAIG